MDTPFKLNSFLLSAALILALSFTGYTQNDNKKSADHLNDSKLENEQSVSYEGNDTATDNEPVQVVRFVRERAFGSTDEVMVGVMGPIAIGPNNEV